MTKSHESSNSNIDIAITRLITIVSHVVESIKEDMNIDVVSDIIITRDIIALRGPGFLKPLPDPNVNRKSVAFDTFLRVVEKIDPSFLPNIDKRTRRTIKINEDQNGRVQLSLEQGVICAVIRILNNQIPSYKELGFHKDHIITLEKIAKHRRGLILISGSTGNGKTTTMAAFISQINKNYAEHIITLEDPIEYQHKDEKSIISQREIGLDVQTFELGLTEIALREKADIIGIGEIKESNEFKLAIDASVSGHLAIATMHANGSINSIKRLFDKLDGYNHHESTNEQISENLVATISQVLVRLINGRTRLLYEIIYFGDRNDKKAINTLYNGNYRELDAILTSQGMQSLEKQVATLLKQKAITLEEANRVSAKI